jgi:MoaA/NifB/PqqE/SkfB family radical SAM enzyme
MSDSFYCAAPWRGLHINPSGSVKTCCAGNPTMLGNIKDSSIEEILTGPVLQEIRQTLRQGRPHEKYCHNCVVSGKYGHSERDWHNNLNPGFDATKVDDFEHVPTLIDIRWNTTCNLSCNYCGELASSKWAALKGIPVKSGTQPYYNLVCDYIEKHQDHIKEVALLGGEPLLLPENERLLDIIPDNATVTVITNMSVNLENNKIFKKLSTRRQVGWSLSFDNIGPQFEYVRYGGNWNLLLKNIQTIKSLFNNGQWAGIHAVYSIYNATCLDEFVDWTREIGIKIRWLTLHQPNYLDPLNHTPEIRNLALKEVQKVLARTDLDEAERSFLEQVEQSHYTNKGVLMVREFQEHIDQIENKYHPDMQGQFVKLWPELVAK